MIGLRERLISLFVVLAPSLAFSQPFSMSELTFCGSTISGNIAQRITLGNVTTTEGIGFPIELVHNLVPAVPHSISRWYPAGSTSYLTSAFPVGWRWKSPSGFEALVSAKQSATLRLENRGSERAVLWKRCEWSYSPEGSLTGIKWNENRQIIAISQGGRVHKLSDSLGVFLEFLFDETGNVRLVKGRGLPEFELSYSAEGQLSVVSVNQQTIVRFSYIHGLASGIWMQGRTMNWDWNAASFEEQQAWQGVDVVLTRVDAVKIRREIRNGILTLLNPATRQSTVFDIRSGAILPRIGQ